MPQAKGRRRRTPTLLVIDDDASIQSSTAALFEQEGYDVRTAASRADGERVAAQWHPHAILLDLVLPDGEGLDLLRRIKTVDPEAEVVILTGHGTIAMAVDALKNGAYSFIAKPAEPDALINVVARAVEKRQLVNENRELRAVAEGRSMVQNIIGGSTGMHDVLDIVRSVAPSDANVLIHGESGTGKELIANAVHRNSPRAESQFVKINCAAVPKDLIESELFGYTKGAFTGATGNREGVFAQASGGSLLLDEIGEMPPLLQTKLLRVLQEREFRPLGGERSRKVDFRLICTTNIDLRKALRDEELREDLFFRINTVTIRVPPLRDRPDDILRLAEHFFSMYRKRHRRRVKRFTRRAMDVLRRYSWPGNVRELEGAIEHAVLLAKSDEVTADDLPEMVRQPESWSSEFTLPPDLTLAQLEKQAILQTLERTRWNKQEAAHRLGLYRPTLYSKMRKHEIDVSPRRSSHSGDDEPSSPAPKT